MRVDFVLDADRTVKPAKLWIDLARIPLQRMVYNGKVLYEKNWFYEYNSLTRHCLFFPSSCLSKIARFHPTSLSWQKT